MSTVSCDARKTPSSPGGGSRSEAGGAGPSLGGAKSARGHGLAVLGALGSGLLLCATHAFFPALALFAPLPLILAVRRASARKAFYLGLICGGAEAMVLAGILHAGLTLWVAICLEYALARAFCVLLVVAAEAQGARGRARPLVWASAWVVTEWLHSQIPYCLPNLLGDTQHAGVLLPLAAVGGTFLLSGLLVWFAAALAALVHDVAAAVAQACSAAMGSNPAARGLVAPGGSCVPHSASNARRWREVGDDEYWEHSEEPRQSQRREGPAKTVQNFRRAALEVRGAVFRGLVRLLVPAIVALVAGMVASTVAVLQGSGPGPRLPGSAMDATGGDRHSLPQGDPWRVGGGGGLAVAIVQGGLPTWAYVADEEDPAFFRFAESVYFEMSRRAPRADLTVWPETSVWRLWGEDELFSQALRALRKERGGSLLVGVPRRHGQDSLSNSALLLTQNGGSEAVDKRRLVIGAEARFAPGTKLPLLHGGGVPIGVIFCLESVVPDYARELVQAGAQVLTVLAEGSRFGSTMVGRMHAQRSIVRAVEVGRPLVHAGQHGSSMLVQADGSHTPMLPSYQAGIVADRLHGSVGRTLFLRFGAWCVAVGAIVLLVFYLRGAAAWARSFLISRKSEP